MQHAGMTRSAFYHYFSGLDDLALALLEQFEDKIRATVDPWITAERVDYRQATIDHLTDMFRVMFAHRRAVGAVAQAASGSPRVYHAWQRRVLDYFIDLTAHFIRRQIMLGRSKVEDPERVARALILMNNAFFNDYLMRDVPDEPLAAGRTVATIWNATIFNNHEPGH